MLKKILIIGLLCFVLLPLSSLAQTKIPKPIGTEVREGEKLPSVTASENISESYVLTSLIPNALKILFQAAAALAVLMIIYAGYLYLFMFQDEANITQAKNIIIYSVVGLLLSIGAYLLVDLIASLSF